MFNYLAEYAPNSFEIRDREYLRDVPISSIWS